MSNDVKNLIRKILPKRLYQEAAPLYHGLMGYLASTYYGYPAREMTLIGVTGTAGKSTTVIMLAHILNQTGHRAGYITTVSSFNGQEETVNQHGLSMPGPWLLQKTLHEFSSRGCKYAVMEATSEGLAQNRHLGLSFDVALFTNLTPAHLDSHGGFENYRKAKVRLFQSLKSSGFLGVNVDDPNYQYFAAFPARKKFGVTTREDKVPQTALPLIRAHKVSVTDNLSFEVEGINFEVKVKGSFNATNAMLAIGAAQYLGIPLQQISDAMKTFGGAKGRMETVPNQRGITIIVDYAPEPSGLEQSLRAAQMIPHNKLIHVFGTTGGHRDVSKRFEFGKLSAQFADTIIITNDDVYDSDPEEIANNINTGIQQAGSNKKASEVLTILNRKAALQKALEIAKEKDLVLVTGKGSEQFLILPGNERIMWEDRKVIEELLK